MYLSPVRYGKMPDEHHEQFYSFNVLRQEEQFSVQRRLLPRS